LIAKTTHKRYANAKDVELFSKGKSLGIFKINEKTPKNEEEEIKSFVEMTGADKVVIKWTARNGHCNEEVVL